MAAPVTIMEVIKEILEFVKNYTDLKVRGITKNTLFDILSDRHVIAVICSWLYQEQF